jgi:hypothetical protein
MRRERTTSWFHLLAAVLMVGAGALWGEACSSSSGTMTADSGKLDTSRDSTEFIDTSMPPRDANVYAWNDAAPPCQPASAAGFSPVMVAPVMNPVCTAAEVAGLVTQCFDPVTATTAGCAAWRAVAENMACLADCPVTSSYAAAPAVHNPPPPPKGPWGPLVRITSESSITFLNLGGCVAAADPSSAAQSCANALNAQFECEYYACAANCPIPVTADASVTEDADGAFENCMLAADSGPCRAYANAADACTGALRATSPAEFCLDGSLLSADSASFDPSFEKLIGDQCGGKTSPEGGSSDAPTDASDTGALVDAPPG